VGVKHHHLGGCPFPGSGGIGAARLLTVAEAHRWSEGDQLGRCGPEAAAVALAPARRRLVSALSSSLNRPPRRRGDQPAALLQAASRGRTRERCRHKGVVCRRSVGLRVRPGRLRRAPAEQQSQQAREPGHQLAKALAGEGDKTRGPRATGQPEGNGTIVTPGRRLSARSPAKPGQKPGLGIFRACLMRRPMPCGIRGPPADRPAHQTWV